MRDALHASHADERHAHEEAIKRLQAEHGRLGERISAMYIDKFDGKIGGVFFDKMAGQWRDEQRRLQRDIDRHKEAEHSYMERGADSRARPQCAGAVRTAARPRKAPPAQLRTFELHLGGWRGGPRAAASMHDPGSRKLSSDNSLAQPS